MENRLIHTAALQSFERYLIESEKTPATYAKYMHDLRTFTEFIGERPLNKLLILEYKAFLGKSYAIRSANSMLAALNTFLRHMGWPDLCVKQFRLQQDAFCSKDKELTKQEYMTLIYAAQQANKVRLSLVIQTICGTGIRVSELQCITVDAARKGEVTVSCKGKSRRILIVKSLRKKLLRYAAEQNIISGVIFQTQSGKPLNRSNIWREMKHLCQLAGIAPEKVYPHNLRHLFARTFYSIDKDIAKLADILGHSNINTTRIYIITTSEEHQRRMENMRLIL